MHLEFLYPEGKRKALTLSYDDGTVDDRRLVEIFNRHGLKSTFHLNSGRWKNLDFVQPEEIPALFAGHEVACHTVNHPFLESLPAGKVMQEIWQNRLDLEAVTGVAAVGMSYPYGTFNDEIVGAARGAGIVYARTTRSTKTFKLPEDWMRWDPTCHHRDALELLEDFKKRPYALSLFYVWGHSFEFERNGNWELIEEFAAKAAGMPDVWYATNLEIQRYLTAIRALTVTADGRTLYNPSAPALWVKAGDTVMRLEGGTTVRL